MSRGKLKAQGGAQDRARAEAAERLLETQFDSADARHDHEIAAWRASSEMNDAAFRRVSQAWEEAERLKTDPDYTYLLGTPTLRERIVAFCRGLFEVRPELAPVRWAFASVVVVMILAGSWLLSPVSREETYSTQIAQIREVPLADGSNVTLGARSALDVEFTSSERTVRLASGEAFFSVTRDAARPFVVLAGGTRIRVVGTKFNVRFDGNRVRVSVLEGVVEVMHSDGRAERIGGGAPLESSITLAAGQQVVTHSSQGQAPTELHGVQPGAWREGRLDYQDTPLSEIVADANRYRTGEIRILSPRLGDERLTMSFRTTQIEQMLQTLPETLPLTVTRNSDGTVELRGRGNGD